MGRYKPKPPRYDEVFFEGPRLLDEMAGLDDCRPMTPEEAEAAAAFVRGKSRLLATIPLGGVSHDRN